MTRKGCVALLVVVLIFSSSVSARDQQDDVDEKPSPGQQVFSLSSKDKEIYEVVEELREAYLLQELQLSGEKAEKVVEKIHAVKLSRKSYALQRYLIENELHALLNSPVPDLVKIDHSLRKLEHSKQLYYQKFVEHDRELRELLDPEEQAKYILFQRAFNRKLRDIVARVRQKHEPFSPNQILRRKPTESVIRQSR